MRACTPPCPALPHPLYCTQPTWRRHIYTNPNDMFNKRTFFDGWTPEKNHYVFASGGLRGGPGALGLTGKLRRPVRGWL